MNFRKPLLGLFAAVLVAQPRDPLLSRPWGSAFELESAAVNGASIGTGTPPAVITIHGGAVLSGHAGTTRFFGGISVLTDGAIKWEESRFAVARETIPEPERVILEALRAARKLSVDQEALVLEGSDPPVKLRFTRLTPARSLERLFGAELFLAAFNTAGKEVPLPEAPLTIRLLAGGQLTGIGPVNRFSASYTVEPGGTLGPIQLGVATQMAGPPEAMQLEGTYFQALSAVTRGRITPGGVIFENADQTTWLRFTLTPR